MAPRYVPKALNSRSAISLIAFEGYLGRKLRIEKHHNVSSAELIIEEIIFE
jgi:hypothetical protein